MTKIFCCWTCFYHLFIFVLENFKNVSSKKLDSVSFLGNLKNYTVNENFNMLNIMSVNKSINNTKNLDMSFVF